MITNVKRSRKIQCEKFIAGKVHCGKIHLGRNSPEKSFQTDRILQNAIMIRVITMIFSIMVKIQFSSAFHVQKCCSMHQRLSVDLESCVDLRAESDQGNEMNRSFQYDWHLPNDTKLLSFRDLKPVASSSLEVEILQKNGSKQSFLPSFQNVFPLDERIFLLDNGSLLLTNKLLYDSAGGIGLYPHWSYCLDNISKDNRTSSGHHRSQISLHFNYVVILRPKDKIPRIRTCCPEHQIHLFERRCENSSNVPKDWIYRVLPSDTKKNFEIINQMPQCDHSHEGTLLNTSTFVLLPDGDAELKDQSTVIDTDHYCLFQEMTDEHNYRPSLLHCPLKQSQFVEVLYIIYYAVGSVFLAATLLVYGLVRELRRTFYARIMVSHVACLLICYSIMMIDNVSKPKPNTLVCKIIAYTLQFVFLAAIFWLNVMCFYISRIFKIKATLQPTHSLLTKNKAYFLYSLYVWGMTSFISIVTYFAERVSFISEDIRPRMGSDKCFFKGKQATFLFFYLPVSLVLLVNLVLFLFTVKGVLGVQKESRKIIGRDSNKHKGNKPVGCEPKQFYKLRLSIKLCALMGITWIFEIVSWSLDVPDYYWYLTDAINSLRGFFIFVICCCKKKVFLLLWNQVCRRGSQNKIEINDYYRTVANNLALTRRLTISSETDSSYQLTVMSTQAMRKASLPIRFSTDESSSAL